jgi:nitrate/TMAO reductase-like tetraheme cytochrome c subunit
MKAYFDRIKKLSFITLLLAIIVLAGSLLCSSFNTGAKIQREIISADSSFAGSLACRNCHQSIYDSFISTAHNMASLLPSSENIKGSFDSGRNHFRYNKLYEVVMEREDSSFYQRGYIGDAMFRQEAFDIVVGSGRKGQSYMYWKNNMLFQLPISYYTPTNSWCNSPGYPDKGPFFDRLANGRCIECHGSFAKLEDSSNNNIEYFDKKSIRYGISCERCHGPSKNHVLFHTANPQEKIAKYILRNKDLSRQQKLDACALCHAGIGKAVKPPFSFVTGDRLKDYYLPKYNTDSAQILDVHGNQYGLLTSSKCFKNSIMNCSSCHDVHQTQINQPALYSSKCMNCHNASSNIMCTVEHDKNMVLSNNCIDCHMPALPSKAIFLQLEDSKKSTPDFVRTHRVAIYPEITSEFIKKHKF